MQVLIVEDELLAAERLKILLNEYDPQIQVVAQLDSIDDTVSYLNTHVHPDLVLLDIALSDGCSFEIFRKVNLNKPIIFTTAYNNYAIDAFSVFSMDYILKPVTREALGKALNKYKSIASGFNAADYAMIASQIQLMESNSFKSRFLVKLGQKLFFVDTADIHFFEADNKIVYLIDKQGYRYTIDYTLEKLEETLNPRQFFRVNRRYLINIAAIEHIKPHYNNRLKLCVRGSQSNDDLIISRERVSQFKLWAEA